MRFAIVLIIVFLSSFGIANASGWKVERENAREIAKGCSLASDFDFLCLEVGCGIDRTVTLHGWLTGEILEGDFQLRIDGEAFAVRGGEHSLENAASKTELAGDMDAIIAAMKSGNMLVVDYPDLQLDTDFASIPLRGSSRAIGAVEAGCAPSGGVMVSEDELLRDPAGNVSIGDLHDTPGCAFRQATGVVEAINHSRPDGGISGMMFLDDRFGSGSIAVQTLEPGENMQTRRATLEYLLTPGRRLSLGVHGCGAAGRIERLVSASEAIKD